MIWMLFAITAGVSYGVGTLFAFFAGVFHVKTARVGFTAMRLGGLVYFVLNLFCIYPILSYINTGGLTTLIDHRGAVLFLLAEWVGLFFVIGTYITFLASRLGPWRAWFVDFNSLTEEEKESFIPGIPMSAARSRKLKKTKR